MANAKGSQSQAVAPVQDTVTVPAELAAKLASLVENDLLPKTFSTGSRGFFGQGKLTAGGERWQATVSVVLVGSKDDASMTVAAELADVAERVASMVNMEAAERTFSSGKRGVYAQGKVTVAGQRYQVSAQAVHVMPKAA